MKNCRKCKIKYKEPYSFCPKCGTPYDEKMKRTKIPIEKLSPVGKIINMVLYVIGGIIAFVYTLSLTKNVFESIIAILFSLSLFKVFYKVVEDKYNTIDEKYFKLARIVLPIILLTIWILCFPSTTSNDSDVTDNNIHITEQENEQEKPQDNEQEKTEEQITEPEDEDIPEKNKEEQQVVSYELKYKLLGEYGKLVEYEGENEYFYYFPSGTYEIEATRVSNRCFLWIDYNEGYNNPPWGTAYNNKQKLQFTKKGEKQTITLTDDVHIYNSNDCNYKLTKKD